MQAFLDFRNFDFRNFRISAVYNSILFFSTLVLLSNLDLRTFSKIVKICRRLKWMVPYGKASTYAIFGYVKK